MEFVPWRKPKKWILLPILLVYKTAVCGLVFVELLFSGMVTPNPFDQLHAKSMSLGSSAFGGTSNTASNLYLSVGSGPYVDFFYTV